MAYQAPAVKILGTVEDLTFSQDKIGDNADFLTATIPTLDGSFVDD